MPYPKKPVAIKQLEGSRIRPADRDQAAWTVPGKMPEPPKTLSLVAVGEWRRIGPEMHAKGLLTEAGLAAFESYCAAVANEREAYVEGDTNRTLKWMEVKLKWMREFGMTPASAHRVRQEKTVQEEDPAAAWMKA